MTVLATWEKLKAEFDRQDAQALQSIIDGYGVGYERLLPYLNALIEYLEAKRDDDGKINITELRKSAVYQNLLSNAQKELENYSAFMEVEVQKAAYTAGRTGLAGERLLILAALAVALGVDVKDVPREAVRQAEAGALDYLADYLRPDGELMRRIGGLVGYTDGLAAGILEQVRLGLPPREIANWFTNQYGIALTDSMRMMRTTQLYSYRQANNAVQMANADVLQGVVWSATLDSRTCMSCVELHGQVFPVGTICNDHHNGRCVMLPYVVGADNPLEQNGDEWFRQQSEATQREMMGNARYEAWAAGKFDLDKITGTYEDGVFGEMRREVPLKELVND